jgi:hypothetical protein
MARRKKDEGALPLGEDGGSIEGDLPEPEPLPRFYTIGTAVQEGVGLLRKPWWQEGHALELIVTTGPAGRRASPWGYISRLGAKEPVLVDSLSEHGWLACASPNEPPKEAPHA